MSALFITEERVRYVDMTKPYMDLGLDTLIAKEGVDGSPFNFFRPFDLKLWMTILCCNFVCGILVTCCAYFSPFGYRGRYIQRRNKDNQKYRAKRSELNLNHSVWHAFVSLLTQVGVCARFIYASNRSYYNATIIQLYNLINPSHN